MAKQNKPKNADNKLTAKALQTVILKLFRDNPKKHYTASNIIKILGIGNNKDSVQYALDQLAETGQLEAARKEKSNKEKLAEKNIENADNQVATSTLDELNAEEKPQNTPRPPRTPRDAREPRPARESRESRPPRRENERKEGREPRFSSGKYEGKVDLTKSGAAYIICEGLEDDVFVHASKLNGALNADKVMVNVFPANGRKRRAEGEIVQVLQRATDHFIGTFRKKSKYALVLPDTEGLPDIYVELEDVREAQEGEKVVVRVTKWLSRANKRLVGVVTSVLGVPGTSDIEMKSILISNGFNIEFPEDVVEESEKISDDIAQEVPQRRDLGQLQPLQ
ncbi:MAG: hypothetical protein HC817_01260 [Saprospiraceae bacterium]|nr:hypothetical protein [Saprospiraceae bacterium]